MDSPTYAAFNIAKTTYKTINGHALAAYILVPKACPPGPRPILVKFHGGFLVLGAALFPPWDARWVFEFARTHGAVLVCPTHRLMPEASGADIAADVRDLRAWLHADFPAYLTATHEDLRADLDRVCWMGESAGAWAVVREVLEVAVARGQSGVRAVLAPYPMLDVGADFFSRRLGTQHPMGLPTLPVEVLDAHLKAMRPGDVVSEVDPPERFDLAVAMVQQGRWTSFLGDDESLFPLKLLEKIPEGGRDVPFMFLFHGANDSAVPVEGTRKFVAAMKRVCGEGKVYFCDVEGMDHGFDGEVGMDEGWMKEGLEKVTEAWLGKE